MKINCPHCNQKIEVSQEHSGILATCPNPECGGEFNVPVFESAEQDISGRKVRRKPLKQTKSYKGTVIGLVATTGVVILGCVYFFLFKPTVGGTPGDTIGGTPGESV